MTVEVLVSALRAFARAGAVGWTPSAEAGPAPAGAPKALAPLLAAGRPSIRQSAYGRPLALPIDFETMESARGSVLITPAGAPAPGWQVGTEAPWHRLEVRGRTLWVGPRGLPVAASDADLLLMVLLGLGDFLQGEGDGSELAAGGLWGEPLHAARAALVRLASALDELPSWPDWIHATAQSETDPEKRVLVLTPAHVPGGEEQLAQLGRSSWSDVPFLFYTRAHKEHLRVLTREALPSSRPSEDKDAARAIGTWLIQNLESALVSSLSFPDEELRIYKKQLFGRTTSEAFEVLEANGYQPALLGPGGAAARTLRENARAVMARLSEAQSLLERADRDAPAEVSPPTPLPRAEGLGPPPPKVEGGRPSLRLAWAALSPADLHSSWRFGVCARDDEVPGAFLRVVDPGVRAVTLRANKAFLPLQEPHTAIAVYLGTGPDSPGRVELLVEEDVRQRGWDSRQQCYRALRLRPFHDVEYGPTRTHKVWHAASKLGGQPAFLQDDLSLPGRYRFVLQLTDDLLDGLAGWCVYVYADLDELEFEVVWQEE